MTAVTWVPCCAGARVVPRRRLSRRDLMRATLASKRAAVMLASRRRDPCRSATLEEREETVLHPECQIRVIGGRVFCLPDVRARDCTASRSSCHRQLPPHPAAAAKEPAVIAFSIDEEIKSLSSAAAGVDVHTFYGIKKPPAGKRVIQSQPDAFHSTDPPDSRLAPTSRQDIPEDRPTSPADSCAGMYSSDEGEEEEADDQPEMSAVGRYYASLLGSREKLACRNGTQPRDYEQEAVDRLSMIARRAVVDLTPNGVREELRRREREDLFAELERSAAEAALRDLRFRSPRKSPFVPRGSHAVSH